MKLAAVFNVTIGRHRTCQHDCCVATPPPNPHGPSSPAPSSIIEASTIAGQGSSSQGQPVNQPTAPSVRAKLAQRTLQEAFCAVKDSASKPSKGSEKRG